MIVIWLSEEAVETTFYSQAAVCSPVREAPHQVTMNTIVENDVSKSQFVTDHEDTAGEMSIQLLRWIQEKLTQIFLK